MSPAQSGGPAGVVVVGYDGSPAALAAIGYAARRVAPSGKLYVVHAYGPPSDWLGYPNYQRVLDEHKSRARRVLGALAAEHADVLAGVDCETELLAGAPAAAIARVAEARGADEIVVGSRGLGRVRAAIGSVALGLLHLARVPVVVVPAAAADDADE